MKKYRVHLALFTVAALYAGNYSIAQFAMPEFVGPYAFIVLRVGVGALFFLMLHAIVKPEAKVERKDLLPLFICSFFGVALNMLAFFKGLSMTSAINASVFMLFSPILVVIFTAIGSRKKISKNVIAGVLLAFVGALLLVISKSSSNSSSNIFGDLLILLNAASYGFYLYYVKRMLKKYAVLTITTYIFCMGFIMVLPFGLNGVLAIEWSSIPTSAWLAIIYVVVGITLVVYLLNAWAIQNSSSTTASSYIYLQPVLAAFIAIQLGKDSLTLEKAIFAVIILSGLYLVNRDK